MESMDTVKNIPSARIDSWGYNDDNHKNSKIYPHHLYEHAEHLISDLNLKKKATKLWPVLYIFEIYYYCLINKIDPETPYYFHCSQIRRDDSQICTFFLSYDERNIKY